MKLGFLTLRGSKGPDIVHQEPIFNNDATVVGCQDEINALTSKDFINGFDGAANDYVLSNPVQSYYPSAKDCDFPRNLKVVYKDKGDAVTAYNLVVIVEVEEEELEQMESTDYAVKSTLEGIYSK